MDERQKKFWEQVKDEKLTHHILYRIKAQKKINLKEGDIFTLEPLKNRYLFGRVLKVSTEKEKFFHEANAAVVFIFPQLYDNYANVPDEFQYNQIL